MSPPHIRVLGVYAPRDNLPEYEAFISRKVAKANPINFSAETKAVFRKLGRHEDLEPLDEDELQEIRQEMESLLSTSALVEVLVENPDSHFDVGLFAQPKPKVPPERWKVAWYEKYLTSDGERLLTSLAYGESPKEEVFRVAFYIHDWEFDCGLNGPYGQLLLPRTQPLPKRLWQLAPYG